MHLNERQSIIGGWLARWIKRKTPPKRLDTEESREDEFEAIVRLLNRHTPTDANADSLRHWLDRLADEMDMTASSGWWPEIKEIIGAYKKVGPKIADYAPTEAAAPTQASEYAGEALAREWIKSPDARKHFIDGSHIYAAQWVRNNNRTPQASDLPEIQLGTEHISDLLASVRDGRTQTSIMMASIIKTANTIHGRRVKAYDKAMELHNLPQEPEWLARFERSLIEEHDAFIDRKADAQRKATIDRHRPNGIKEEQDT